MAGISQQIPNYILGISEQPDELKQPGQVVDLQNGVPDITHGLVKRPGGKLIAPITPNSGTLSWFHVYETEEDQYIGCVKTDGVIQIWRTRDGAVIPVDYASVPGTNLCSYLTGWTKSTDIQPLTLNQSTFLTNRSKTVAMKTATSDLSPAEVHEAIIEITTVSYGKQYALDLYDPGTMTSTSTTRATSIEIDEHSTHGHYWGGESPSEGKCKKMGRAVITVAPNTVRTGTKNLRVDYDVRCQPVVDPDNPGSSTSGAQYDNAYQPFIKLQFGGEGFQTGDTFNISKEDGFSSQVKVKSHVTLSSRATITGGQGPNTTCMVRPAATSSSTDESVTAAGILGDMKTALTSLMPSGMTVNVVGNCLHIKHIRAFNVTTPEPTLMNIVTSEANNVGELPKTCRHNYVVKIVNSSDDDDDYYLKFQVDNVASSETADRFGTGTWIECPKPGITVKIDPDTMPVQIRRVLPGTYSINGGSSQTYSNGVFEVVQPDWIDRHVGDETTNPDPSFIGKKIQKLLFFRNRICVLADEFVVLSVSNDFYNFFSNTAMAVSSDDPIDLISSSTYPTVLYDAIEVNSGLLIHSSSQQFMLTTDSDSFSASTAKINYLCSYNFNHDTVPFSMGTTSGFINSTGKNARFYEMSNVRREGEPTVTEQSKIVSKKLPIGIRDVTVSKENNIILFGTYDSDEVWGYRYFNSGDRRLQSAWFRWKLPGNVIYHKILDDVYYAVLKNGSNYTLEAFDVKKQDDTTSITDYRIHLDTHSTLSPVSISQYDSDTKLTTFAKPAGYNNSSKQLAVYDNNAGNNIGRYALATVSGSNLTVPGDWTGVNFILGYQIDWLVELPTIYTTKTAGDKRKADTSASLVIHRLHFTFGETGTIETTLKRKGRPDYTNTYESIEWDSYLSNKTSIADEYTHTIPVYERNTNLTVQLKSSHPSPATLHSLNWEGDYNNRFYRRA
tara:strand:- start:10103 stop:12961 length:2859 start_codon:yes stop_codon:yes gene_type:complete